MGLGYTVAYILQDGMPVAAALLYWGDFLGVAVSMPDKITLLLVDDHPVVRQGLRLMLSAEADLEVVGEAASGEEALQRVQELRPQVVLMDIRLPGMSGTEATRLIKEARPDTLVIVMSMYDSEMYVLQAIRAGASGYLIKDSPRALLCEAIRTVVDGGTIVPKGVLRSAAGGLGTGAGLRDPRRLSAREMEVLRLLAEGYANKAIASELNLAEVTVKKHVQSIIGKLGVSDRTQATVVSVRLGLVE